MYGKQPGLIESHLFDRDVIHEIQRAATEGIYDIRGWGAKRRLPHFDDLVFLGASMSRYPLEGYRERCDTNVTLGTRYAKKPIELLKIVSSTHSSISQGKMSFVVLFNFLFQNSSDNKKVNLTIKGKFLN